ncbi:MAG: hypothetical protein OEN02_03150 [Gammaproteobacteria bacterium]|nr:hypothetical protein [Gammaproteobacteria bacterium]MDH3467818.1 hypothetical protein [Gammaproteobacteria bacterium]
MSGYSNGIQTTHVVSVTTSGTTAAGNIVGPAGKTGRITGITGRTTTAFTVANATLTVRTKGGAGNTYATKALPFTGSGIDDVDPDFTVDDVSDTPTHVGRIAANDIVELVSDGGHTAGAAEFTVTIEWS